jgi:hypothetical protein
MAMGDAKIPCFYTFCAFSHSSISPGSCDWLKLGLFIRYQDIFTIGGFMKPLFVFTFVLFVFLTQAPNSYAGMQDFVLINETGVEINSLYLSPTKSNKWGDDILGDEVLADGEQATINFVHDQDSCLWDFSVSDPAKTSVSWKGIDLCKYQKITLHIKGEKVWATFE